jgi:ABC-type amino acid transport substrate-binding protein
MRKLFLFTAVFMALICFTAATQTKIYKIAVYDYDYYPHHAIINGEYAGFARELLDAFAKSKGYKFEYKPFPVIRLMNEYLTVKSVDLVYPDNAYWDTEIKKGKAVIYSDGVEDYIDGLMVKPELAGKGMANIKNIGTILGFTVWDYKDLIDSGKIKLHENSQLQGLLKMGLTGRIEGVYTNIAVGNYYLNDVLKEKGKLVYDASLPHTQGKYYLSTISQPALIKELNDYLKKEKVFVETLKKKYNVNIN